MENKDDVRALRQNMQNFVNYEDLKSYVRSDLLTNRLLTMKE